MKSRSLNHWTTKEFPAPLLQIRNLRLRGRAAHSQSWDQVTLTRESTLLTFLPSCGDKREQDVSEEASAYEALTGAAPCFPSRHILGCVCGPAPPSHEDSGSARTMYTVPQGRVGAPDVIPAVGPWPSPAVEMRLVIQSSVLGGGDRKEKPLPSLIPGSRGPSPACPRGSSVNVGSNRTRTWGVEGHPL